MLVGCARRRVDEEIVKWPPVDIFQELLDDAIFLWPTPNYGRGGRGEKEADGDDGKVWEDGEWENTGGC